MNNIGLIYKITSPSGKCYIGQSKNIKSRLYNYKNGCCKGQPKLYNSIQKYGWDNHLFEIIDQCSIELNKDELDNKEKHWIKFYDSHHNGLNCNDGGSGHLGRKQSPEHIAKRREFLKKKGRGLGRKRSPETRAKTLKPVLQYDLNNILIKEWKSIKEAKESGFHHTSIIAVCKGRKKSYMKCNWVYK